MQDACLDDGVEHVVLLHIVGDNMAFQQIVAHTRENDLVAQLGHLLAGLAAALEYLLGMVAEEVGEGTELGVDDVVGEEIIRLEDACNYVTKLDHAFLLLDLPLRVRLQSLHKLDAVRRELLETPLLLEGFTDVFGDLLHV